MLIRVGVSCRISYSVVSYSYVSFSALIPSVGEERAIFSAIVYLLLCGFCSEGFPLPLIAGDRLRYLSLVVRKPACCICENKDADQLRSNCAADHRLCFRYTDSTIPLLPKSEISSI